MYFLLDCKEDMFQLSMEKNIHQMAHGSDKGPLLFSWSYPLYFWHQLYFTNDAWILDLNSK